MKVGEIKAKYPKIFNGKHLSILRTNNQKVLGFLKKDKNIISVILFNTNFYRKERFCVKLNMNVLFYDLLKERNIDFSNSIELKRGDTLLSISK